MDKATEDGSAMHGTRYAKDAESGKLCVAAEEPRASGRTYVCTCPDAHRVCLRLPSGRAGVRYVTPHFAHLCVRDEMGGKVVHGCRPGGESEEHKSAKHKLVAWQGRYRFELERCPECGKAASEDCKGGQMGIETRSDDKRWYYDVTLKRADGSTVALEVWHKHATTAEKIRSSLAQGVVVAEFRSEDIASLEPGGTLRNLQCKVAHCSAQCRDSARERAAAIERREMEAKQLELKAQKEADERRAAMMQQRAAEEKAASEKRIALMQQRAQEAKEADERRAAIMRQRAEQEKEARERRAAEVRLEAKRRAAFKRQTDEERIAFMRSEYERRAASRRRSGMTRLYDNEMENTKLKIDSTTHERSPQIVSWIEAKRAKFLRGF